MVSSLPTSALHLQNCTTKDTLKRKEKKKQWFRKSKGARSRFNKQEYFSTWAYEFSRFYVALKHQGYGQDSFSDMTGDKCGWHSFLGF